MKEKIIHLYEEYYSEMMAEGAWCGHEYATAYLEDLKNELLEFFNEVRGHYQYKKGYLYKDNELCISHVEKAIFESANRGAFYLSTDYNELIDKVYADESFSSQNKHDIADALNTAFKNKLEDAVQELENIASGNNIELDKLEIND